MGSQGNGLGNRPLSSKYFLSEWDIDKSIHPLYRSCQSVSSYIINCSARVWRKARGDSVKSKREIEASFLIQLKTRNREIENRKKHKCHIYFDYVDIVKNWNFGKERYCGEFGVPVLWNPVLNPDMNLGLLCTPVASISFFFSGVCFSLYQAGENNTTYSTGQFQRLNEKTHVKHLKRAASTQ